MNKKLPVVFIGAGEIYFSSRPSEVMTVLGSCVSVTMFNRHLKIGYISHNLLPSCRDEHSCKGACPERFRYVECTIKWMLKKFSSLGIGINEIEVKLFGGSDMFDSGGVKNGVLTVGKQNIEKALRILGTLGLKPAASDTGGKHGRKIIFHTHSGKVYLKRLNKADIKEY